MVMLKPIWPLLVLFYLKYFQNRYDSENIPVFVTLYVNKFEKNLKYLGFFTYNFNTWCFLLISPVLRSINKVLEWVAL